VVLLVSAISTNHVDISFNLGSSLRMATFATNYKIYASEASVQPSYSPTVSSASSTSVVEVFLVIPKSIHTRLDSSSRKALKPLSLTSIMPTLAEMLANDKSIPATNR
jgi:hypothetical protein